MSAVVEGAEQDFTGWLPIRLFVRDETVWVDWCYRGDAALHAPFFQDDAQRLLQLPFNQAFRRYTPMAVLVAWANQSEGEVRVAPLKAFVAHVSRCGSTLISQMLAHQPTHVVMSEPPMLDMLINIRYRLPQVSRDQQIEWLRALVCVLGQAPTQQRHLVIKLDAWHIVENELISEAFPEVPWIFLYRDPVEVAASQLLQRASYMVPGMVSAITRLEDVQSMLRASPESHIAAVLGKFFEAGALVCERGGALAVNYRALPSALWTTIGETLGLCDDAETIASLEASAGRNAKTPQMTFEPDSERKQSVASAALREAVTASCGGAYERLQALAR